MVKFYLRKSFTNFRHPFDSKGTTLFLPWKKYPNPRHSLKYKKGDVVDTVTSICDRDRSQLMSMCIIIIIIIIIIS